MDVARDTTYASAIEMAEWKDEVFAEEKKQLLERAGDWWELILRQGNLDVQIALNSIVEKFKEDMKGK